MSTNRGDLLARIRRQRTLDRIASARAARPPREVESPPGERATDLVRLGTDEARRATEASPGFVPPAAASTTDVVQRETDAQKSERIRRSLEGGEQLSRELGLPVTRGVPGPAERTAERIARVTDPSRVQPTDATRVVPRAPGQAEHRPSRDELLAQPDAIRAPTRAAGASIRGLPDRVEPVRTTDDVAAVIEDELERERTEELEATLDRMRSRVRDPSRPHPTIGPQPASASTERAYFGLARREAEAQAERIRRALPPGVTMAARAARGVSHSPLVGQFLVRPAVDLYNEHVRDGKMSADEFLGHVRATGSERAAEIIGNLAGYGIEISTTGRFVGAAGRRVPGNAGAFLRDFDPARATTRARAAMTGALEGIPSDVAAAVEHGDPSQVPVGMTLGAVAGPLFRRTESREELLARIASQRQAREVARPTRQDAPGSTTSTPEATQPRVEATETTLPPAAAAPAPPATTAPDPQATVAERGASEAAALEAGRAPARLQTRRSTYRDREGFTITGRDTLGRPVKIFVENEDAVDRVRTRIMAGEEVRLEDMQGGSGPAARRSARASKSPEVVSLERRASTPDETASPLAAEHVRVSEALPEAGAFSSADERTALGKIQSPVRTIEDMRTALAKLMGGLKVAEGGMQRSGRAGTKLGELKSVPQVIRQASASDVRVFAHEMGHALQKLLLQGGRGHIDQNAFDGLDNKLKRQLQDLAVGISDESNAEGWAEYWRRFIDNPESLGSVPDLDRWVQERLDAVPQLRGALDQMREQWALYRAGGPEARIESHISRGDDPRNLSIEDTWSRFRTNILDTFEPLRQVVEHVRARGIDVPIEEDAEALARLVAGAPGQAEHALDFGPLSYRTGERATTADGEFVKPLREIVESIEDVGSLEQFERYALARRTLEVKGRNISTGIRPEDAADIVPRLDGQYKEAFGHLQDYQDALLRYLVDAGVVSERSYAAMKDVGQSYVPLYRALGDRAGFLGGSQFGHLFSPVKRLKGSGKNIVPPLESIVKNTFLYTELAAKQRVSDALASLAGKEGVGEWLEGLVKPVQRTEFKLGEIEGQLEEILPGLGEVLEQLRKASPGEDPAEELLAIFRPGDMVGRKNTISVLRDGKREYFEVDADLYAALEGLDREQIGWLGKVGSIPASTLRAGATLTPEFSIRNVLRDQVMAFVQSEYGYTPFFDMARGMSEVLSRGETYQKWLASGGQRASLLGLDRNAMQQKVQELVKSGGVPNVIKNPLDGLRALSSLLEDATRVGEFSNALKAEGDTLAGRMKAASASREISIDFSRHGAKLAALRASVAFWNARMQGYDRLARAFKRDPHGATIRAFSAITVPSILEYAAYRDDPEYWEIPQWQRDLFWVTKVGDSWLRIPKPFELGLVFGTLPQRIMASLDAQDPEGLTRFIQRTLPAEAEGMFPVPTAFMPLIENWANYSAFMDRPIVPQALEDVSPEYQSSRSTSEAARMLGRWTGASPMKIDNLLQGWTGGMGRTVSQGVDLAVRTVRGDPERPTPTAADIPVVRALTIRDDGFGAESVERFYDLYGRATTAEADVRLKEREQDREELQRLMGDPENTRLIASLPRLRRAAGDLAQIRAQREIVYRDPDMSADEKRERIDELGRRYLQIAKTALGRELPGT